jgi:hypothetical protein
LSEWVVVAVGNEAATKDDQRFLDAVTQTIPDAKALGVTFGLPLLPDAIIGSGSGAGNRDLAQQVCGRGRR